LEVKPTGKKSEEGEEKGNESSAAHLVERLCEGSREKGGRTVFRCLFDADWPD
jgi:hypothetical protein